MNGRYVAVTSVGEGRPLLMLHGYMSQKESFYYQIKYFSDMGFNVVAPDFPGFGRSAPLTSEWSVGDYAAWLYDFSSSLGLERADVVAHSFGARVAIKLLSRRELYNRLLITGGAGLVKRRPPSYRIKVGAYRAVKRFAPSFAERVFGSAEYRALGPVMRGSYKKIVNEDLKNAAAQVKNTVLLVYGRDDTVTPPSEEGRTFASLIPNSRLVTMEGDHFCFCRHPAQFNALARAFFTEE